MAKERWRDSAVGCTTWLDGHVVGKFIGKVFFLEGKIEGLSAEDKRKFIGKILGYP
jgi:hypothetical protein